LVADGDQVIDGDVALDAVALAEESALVAAGQVQGGLAEGLGGDGAGVDLRPADDGVALDDDDALAELGGLDGGLLPGRPGADDGNVVVAHGGAPAGLALGNGLSRMIQ